MNELPLQTLFSRLRNAGLSIGVDEYNLLLSALQGGFGLENRSSLRHLCRTLWAKSLEEQLLIDQYFDQFIRRGDNEQEQAEIGQREQITSTSPVKKKALFLSLSMLATGIACLFLYRKFQRPVSLPTSLNAESGEVSSSRSLSEDQTVATELSHSVWRWWLVYGTIAVTIGAVVTSLFFGFILPRQLRLSSLKTFSTSSFRVTQETNDRNDNNSLIAQPSSYVGLKDSLLLRNDYLPVSQRQMTLIWRYLSRRNKGNALSAIDVEATIRSISYNGVISDFVYLPSLVSNSSLLLLIDRGGSMVPFEAFSMRIIDTARRGSSLNKLGVYYFQNYPASNWKYPDDYLLEAAEGISYVTQRISHILSKMSSSQTGCLIFSDAGAARGGINENRVLATQNFLSYVGKRVRNVVWLNPLPESRWFGTTAESIATQVSMVEANRAGIASAISVLRGQERRIN